MSRLVLSLAVVVALSSSPGNAFAAPDAEGCKDHPLFTRMPAMHIESCKQSQFEQRRFPTGAIDASSNHPAKPVDVEGPTYRITYAADEGTPPASGLQIMRNFQNAARKAGATIEGQYPGWCKGMYEDPMPEMGNGCLSHALTMKFAKGGKEIWVFEQAGDGSYSLTFTEREAMKQDIAANDLLEQLNKNGFVAMYFNFDTGKATLQPDAASQLDQIAQMLKANAALRLEIAGHTDNVGKPNDNQKLSEARANTIVKELVKRGIATGRLTAKGYGQGSPMADNRTEEGRAKNRRVELVKL